jgi:hypothetical protein
MTGSSSVRLKAFKEIEKMAIAAGRRLGLKNRQVGEKWVSDDCSYLCKGL